MPDAWEFFWPTIVFEAVSLALLVIVAVTVSTVRNEPDATGRRLTATYLSVVMFVSLFVAVVSATTGVGSLAHLVGDESEETMYHSDTGMGEPVTREDEDFVATAVRAFALSGVATGVLLYHRRRMVDLVDDEAEETTDSGPATRIVHGYLYASQALALLGFVAGASLGLFGFAKAVVPDALSTHDTEEASDEGVRDVFTGTFLAVASLGVVRLQQVERERMDEVDDDQEDDDEPIA